MADQTKVQLTEEQRRAFARLGRAGGLKRAENLTEARRKKIATKASKAAAKARKRKAKERKA